MHRWLSAFSLRDNRSEMGSVNTPNQIALSKLVNKKKESLFLFFKQFHEAVSPDKSGVLYHANEKQIDDLIQLKCLEANRQMIMETEASTINYLNHPSRYPPSILNSSIAPSNSHVFKQPALPQQTFRPPDPVSSYRENTQDSRERFTNSSAIINKQIHQSMLGINANTMEKNDSPILKRSNIDNCDNAIRRKKGFITNKLIKPSANFSVNNRAENREDSVQIGLSEKENLVRPESEDESIISEEAPERCRPKKNLKKRKLTNSNSVVPTPSTSSETETLQVLKVPSPSLGTVTGTQVTERSKKDINIEPVSSTKDIDKCKKSEFDFIVKNWTIALVDKSLRVQGDKYDRDGSALIKSHFTSPPILCLKNRNLIKTNKCTYALDGKLCDPNNAIPDTIKSMCTNKTIPMRWRKLLAIWIEIESEEAEGHPISQEVSKIDKTKLKPQKENSQNLEGSKNERTVTKSQKEKSVTEEGPKNEGLKAKPQKKKSITQERPKKKETKTKPQKEKCKTQKGSTSVGTKTKAQKVKTKTNSKNKVKGQNIINTNKKSVFEEMMTNNSIMCTSMTPNGLLNSIKKSGNDNLSCAHTPPVKLLNELNRQKTDEPSENDSEDDFIKVHKHQPTVSRLAKVFSKGSKAQHPPKPNPKPKIQPESSFEKSSVDFSNLSSIIDENSD